MDLKAEGEKERPSGGSLEEERVGCGGGSFVRGGR